MSMIRPMASINLLHSLNLLRRYRAHRVHNPSRYLDTSTYKIGHCFSTNQRTSSSDVQPDAEMENKHLPEAPRPPKPKFPTWARWALGWVLSLFLPFWNKKWEKLLFIQDSDESQCDGEQAHQEYLWPPPLQLFQNQETQETMSVSSQSMAKAMGYEVVKVAEVAENVAEVVEAVAEVTEKIASEVVDHLPDGGKLKKAVTLVGEVSKEAAKDAQLAKEFIHKVEDVKQEVETLVEPVVYPEKLKEKVETLVEPVIYPEKLKEK